MAADHPPGSGGGGRELELERGKPASRERKMRERDPRASMLGKERAGTAWELLRELEETSRPAKL